MAVTDSSKPRWSPSGPVVTIRCETCGGPGTARVWDIKRGRGKFCSRKCGTRPPVAPLEQRFWAKVDRRGPDECWPWLGNVAQGGYGSISVNNHNRRASRISWELEHKRPFPAGMHALHSCDNPPCVNPAHIRPGTPDDNAKDAVARKRHARVYHPDLPISGPPRKRGHPYSIDNAYRNPNGSVECRACRAIHGSKRRAIAKEARRLRADVRKEQGS